MAYAIQKVRPRHYLVILHAFNGLSNKEIAEKLGMHPGSVGCILRSPAARAEMERLAAKASQKSTDIPARVALHHELVSASEDSLRVNRALLQDPHVKPETRARIGQHFMDRVLFNRGDSEDEGRESYRDILRRIDQLQAEIRLRTPDVDGDLKVLDLPVGVGGDKIIEEATEFETASQNGKHVIDMGDDV